MYVRINKDASIDESVHAEGMAYFKKMEEGSLASLSVLPSSFYSDLIDPQNSILEGPQTLIYPNLTPQPELNG